MGIGDIGRFVLQYLNEPARQHLLADQPAGQPSKTAPGDGRIGNRSEVVEPQSRLWHQPPPGIGRSRKDPTLVIIAPPVDDAFMF